MNDMGYSFPFFQDAALDNDQTFRFNEATMGICRDEISDLTNENVWLLVLTVPLLLGVQYYSSTFSFVNL